MKRAELLYFVGAFFSSFAAGVQDVMTLPMWARLLSLSAAAGVTAVLGCRRPVPARKGVLTQRLDR